jgi:hypothetical protein
MLGAMAPTAHAEVTMTRNRTHTGPLHCVTVTQSPGPRCAYCRRPIPERTGPGRPAAYCRRSHRQRAYEARRRADRASLPTGHVVAAQADIDRLHDRLYALEAALDDVAADLADVRPPRAGDAAARAYAEALAHLVEVAEDLRGAVVEPVR